MLKFVVRKKYGLTWITGKVNINNILISIDQLFLKSLGNFCNIPFESNQSQSRQVHEDETAIHTFNYFLIISILLTVKKQG